MVDRLVIISGPDARRDHELRTDRVRVGVGPTADFRLSDPQLQEGELLIERQDSVFFVTNRLPFTVLLDGAKLGRNDRQVWYHETELQPTAETLIRLTTEAPRQSRRLPRLNLELIGIWCVAIVLLLVAAVILFRAGGGTPSAPNYSDGQLRNEAAEALEQMDNLRSDAKRWGIAKDWDRLATAFAKARLLERSSNSKALQDLYQQCRHAVEGLQNSPPFDQNGSNSVDARVQDAIRTLERIRLVINQRLIQLDQTRRSRR